VRWSGVSLAALFGAVTGVTIANRLGAVDVTALASSPRAAGEGKVWLLGTSALVADTPTAASLLAFFGFALVVLYVCGPRLTWIVGVAGHIGSAAAIYALIAVSRAFVPSAFAGVLSLSDYGTSAMIAAWLGALAAVAWMRRPGLAWRLGIIGFSLFAAFVGWLCRPDLTPLDSEHIVAYGIGVAAVSGAEWAYARRVLGEWWRVARAVGAWVVGLFRRGLAPRQQQV
jgi:hypothetical protein